MISFILVGEKKPNGGSFIVAKNSKINEKAGECEGERHESRLVKLQRENETDEKKWTNF